MDDALEARIADNLRAGNLEAAATTALEGYGPKGSQRAAGV